MKRSHDHYMNKSLFENSARGNCEEVQQSCSNCKKTALLLGEFGRQLSTLCETVAQVTDKAFTMNSMFQNILQSNRSNGQMVAEANSIKLETNNMSFNHQTNNIPNQEITSIFNPIRKDHLPNAGNGPAQQFSFSKVNKVELATNEEIMDIRTNQERRVDSIYDVIVCNIPLHRVLDIWENDYLQLPPVNQWSARLKQRHANSLQSWWDIVSFYRLCLKNQPYAFDETFSKANNKMCSVEEALSIIKNFDVRCNRERESNYQNLRNEFHSNIDEIIYELPRKIDGKMLDPIDIICIWEYGYKEMPPIKNWTPFQKSKQQSKLSRWRKIVNIFKSDCHGSKQMFTQKFTGYDGMLMSISNILELYKSPDNVSIEDSM